MNRAQQLQTLLTASEAIYSVSVAVPATDTDALKALASAVTAITDAFNLIHDSGPVCSQCNEPIAEGQIFCGEKCERDCYFLEK